MIHNASNRRLLLTLFALCYALTSCSIDAYDAPWAKQAPKIDGINDDIAWSQAPWGNIDQHIEGSQPTPADFSGRFKLVWDEQQLYLLAEITDDILIDRYSDPLHRYWDDDCLEVFIDEDRSGGNHQFDVNAFAYHVALDNQVVDIAPAALTRDTKKAAPAPQAVLLNDHVTSVWKRDINAPHKIIWELGIRVYDDTFTLPSQMNTLSNLDTVSKIDKHSKIDTFPKTQANAPAQLAPLSQSVALFEGKKMGFMLAYCDNDGSETREHFFGSQAIKPIDGSKNLGYITADVFGELNLVR